MPRKSKAGRRRYQRFYMAVWRVEKQGKSDKGGTIGGVGEGRIHKGGNPDLLVPNVSPLEQRFLALEATVMAQGQRLTMLEAERVLLDAMVRQAEEWSS